MCEGHGGLAQDVQGRLEAQRVVVGMAWLSGESEGDARCQLQGLRTSLGCSPGERTEQNHPEAGRRTGGDLGLPPRHPGTELPAE